MSKRKDGVFSLLRHIIGNQKKIIKEQEKQTKILQTIESSLEHIVKELPSKSTDEVIKGFYSVLKIKNLLN